MGFVHAVGRGAGHPRVVTWEVPGKQPPTRKEASVLQDPVGLKPGPEDSAFCLV